ncbi:hypothetical protein [Paenibacillus sp. NPDC058071]|uniref:hypothetical protein n=1 Tax=Paenibacillus sp. NPDC058071 TaxID=3346326 RepID=UPI0036DD8C42
MSMKEERVIPIKLRWKPLSVQSKYTLLSALSLLGVTVLHLLHWLSLPLLMEAATGVQADMQGHGHHHGAGGTQQLSPYVLALYAVNLVSMYFAVRQLYAAIVKRGAKRGSGGLWHTAVCSIVSLLALAMGIYTFLSL